MKKYDYCIVGAGLYGSVMAERLTSIGKSVLVIDKRDHIGGNCASKKRNGIDVHLYGPHVFHTNNKTAWEHVNNFGEFRKFTHKVLSNYKNNVYNFPIDKKTREDFLNNEYKEDPPVNLEDDIFNAFFKEYSEKQWNCNFEDVPKNAIKRIPVRDNYNDSYFNDYYQGIPVEGYNELFKRLLILAEIKLNCRFVPEFKDIADKIIYTGPIDEYFNNCHGKLSWRSLEFKFKEEHIQDFQGISVMHYPEKKYPYTRITEFKHFNPFSESFSQNYTVYAEEYPCSNPDEPYYPIENEENLKILSLYMNMASGEENVLFAGRLGTYQYNDMDVTVLNALNDFSLIKRGIF